MRAELAVTDEVEYAEVRRVADLTIPTRAEGHLLLAVAARVEPARLIDNLALHVDNLGVRDAALLEEPEASG
jgi:pantothenate synthetase